MCIVLHQLHNPLGRPGAAFGVHRQLQLAVCVKFGNAGAGGVKHVPAVVRLPLPADLILIGDLSVSVEILRYVFCHFNGLVDCPGSLSHKRIRVLQTVLGLQIPIENDNRRAALALESHIAVGEVELVAERHVPIKGMIPPFGFQAVEGGIAIQVVQRAFCRKRAAVIQAGIDKLIGRRAADDDLGTHGLQHRAARTRSFMQALLDNLYIEIFFNQMIAGLDSVVDARSQLFTLIIIRIFVFHILCLGLVLRIHTRTEDSQRTPAVILLFHIVPDVLFFGGLRIRGSRVAG